MKRIRIILVVFIILFFLSGMTVFPVQWEVETVIKAIWGDAGPDGGFWSPVHRKLIEIRDALPEIKGKYPFGLYGLDWLGFAFITMSILFLGVLRDPVKNKWVIQFALICCALTVPFAAVFAPLRGMPWQWVLIDSSFGVFGAIPLIIILRDIIKIEKT